MEQGQAHLLSSGFDEGLGDNPQSVPAIGTRGTREWFGRKLPGDYALENAIDLLSFSGGVYPRYNLEEQMAKTSEPAFGLAVMQVLAGEPSGKATVRSLVKKVPDYVKLTEEDRQPSETRPYEEMWEQRVRNLKSHDRAEGNVIGEGLVAHVGRGTYQLTEAGWLRLKNKGLA